MYKGNMNQMGKNMNSFTKKTQAKPKQTTTTLISDFCLESKTTKQTMQWLS